MNRKSAHINTNDNSTERSRLI